MWSGGPDAIGSVRPTGKWAQGLTCQTAFTPACDLQIVMLSVIHLIHISILLSVL